MNAQELLVHDGSQGQAAEGLHACLIDSLRVLVLAFKLEGEVVGQVTTLVIASQEPQRLGVVDLQSPEIQDTFDTKVATVDVVAQEEVSRLGRVASDFEELHQIVVLSMHVTAHGDRGVHLEEVRLGAQEVSASPDNP